jgi:glycerol uptake facilitator protein
MSPFIAELLGTMTLIILGGGVVAGVVLKHSKSFDGGWIVISTGWGLGVAVAVYMVGAVSGAHINPAVTIAMAFIDQGGFGWSQVPAYLLAQLLGAILGAVVVWLAYLPHWEVTENEAAKLAVFCTAPAIRKPFQNLITEIVGTFILVLGVLTILRPENLTADSGFNTGMGPLLVGMLVLSIGLSLGGPTGYAINPARDLGPRIAHALLPIKGKGGSDWSYAWVPVVGPIVGGIIGAMVFKMLWATPPTQAIAL